MNIKPSYKSKGEKSENIRVLLYYYNMTLRISFSKNLEEETPSVSVCSNKSHFTEYFSRPIVVQKFHFYFLFTIVRNQKAEETERLMALTKYFVSNYFLRPLQNVSLLKEFQLSEFYSVQWIGVCVYISFSQALPTYP